MEPGGLRSPTPGRSSSKVKVNGGSAADARKLEAKRQFLFSRRNNKRHTQEITFFGLIWKRGKNDPRSRKIKADDFILGSHDGVGSPMKPTCYFCFKPYRSDLMYIRCELCRNWFHGDALELEEGRISELISYRCCRCRRRPLPRCPYSDFHYSKAPEPKPIRKENADDMLSSDEAVGTDGDPPFASSGRVESTVEETIDADFSVNMKRCTPGSFQEPINMDASSHSTQPVSKVGHAHVAFAKEVRPFDACVAWYVPGARRRLNLEDDNPPEAATVESNFDNDCSVILHQAYDGFRAIAAKTGSLYERLRQKDHLTSDDIMVILDKLQHLALHHMKDIACHQTNDISHPKAPPQSMHTPSTQLMEGEYAIKNPVASPDVPEAAFLFRGAVEPED
uniref:PHD-type domain-containing protein n=1 Tax=Leersia perrieri TaxID=77586 RepID=A0A0D9XP32_9ORYZ